MHERRNVLGGQLATCSNNPVTGFWRTGCCDTGEEDIGSHTVCVQVTEEFLAFSLASGNDLTTPHPGFPGLKPGDRWCVCVLRWKDALDSGVAPPVVLEATHEAALEFVSLKDLFRHAVATSSPC